MSNVRLPVLGETAAILREEDLMQVGDLARETGKTVRAIHRYEQRELLQPAAVIRVSVLLYLLVAVKMSEQE